MPPGGNPGKEIIERRANNSNNKNRNNRSRRRAALNRDERQNRRDDMPDNTGGGGGGSTNNAPDLFNADRQTPNSQLGQGIDSALWGDMMSNPDALATKWMGMNGIDTMAGGGMTKTFNDMANVMPSLFTLIQGMGGPSDSTPAAFMDFADQFLNQATTSSQYDPNIIGNLFNAGPDSGLGQTLNQPGQDMSQQLSTLMGLLGGGLSQTLTPTMGSAMMGNAEQLAREWMSQGDSLNQGTFVDFLKSKGFDQYFQ